MFALLMNPTLGNRVISARQVLEPTNDHHEPIIMLASMPSFPNHSYVLNIGFTYDHNSATGTQRLFPFLAQRSAVFTM